MLLTEFNQSILERALTTLWAQWGCLGVAGNVEGSLNHGVIDPEALVLATLHFGRYDARLFDEVLDWLVKNGDLISLTRLIRMINVHHLKDLYPALLGISRFLEQKEYLSTRWNTKRIIPKNWEKPERENILFCDFEHKPLPEPRIADSCFSEFGLLREKISLRGYSQVFPQQGASSMLLRMRALLGLSSRCELLCLLACSKGMSTSQLAAMSGYALRTVQETLSEMSRSGIVNVGGSGKKKIYFLNQSEVNSFFKGDVPRFTPQTQFYTILIKLHSAVALAMNKGGDGQLTVLLVRNALVECLEAFHNIGCYQLFRAALDSHSSCFFDCLWEDIQCIEAKLFQSEVMVL